MLSSRKGEVCRRAIADARLLHPLTYGRGKGNSIIYNNRFFLPSEILEKYRVFPSEGRKGKFSRISLEKERKTFEFFLIREIVSLRDFPLRKILPCKICSTLLSIFYEFHVSFLLLIGHKFELLMDLHVQVRLVQLLYLHHYSK